MASKEGITVGGQQEGTERLKRWNEARKGLVNNSSDIVVAIYEDMNPFVINVFEVKWS
jgi:hypothetical protein